jgi:hypothetical protein
MHFVCLQSATIVEEHKLLENCTPLITIVIVVYLSCLDRDLIYLSVLSGNQMLFLLFSTVWRWSYLKCSERLGLRTELTPGLLGTCCSLRIVFMRNQSVYNGC